MPLKGAFNFRAGGELKFTNDANDSGLALFITEIPIRILPEKKGAGSCYPADLATGIRAFSLT